MLTTKTITSYQAIQQNSHWYFSQKHTYNEHAMTNGCACCMLSTAQHNNQQARAMTPWRHIQARHGDATQPSTLSSLWQAYKIQLTTPLAQQDFLLFYL